MKIEEEIKQSVFKSAHSKALVNIMFTNNWLCNIQMEILKPYDVTLQQYNVLRILRGQYPTPITVCGIIERMLDKMSNASRLVDKLLTKELVERRECPLDRRQVDVIITDKGLALLTKIDECQQSWEARLHGISEAEAEELSMLLDKVRNSLK